MQWRHYLAESAPRGGGCDSKMIAASICQTLDDIKCPPKPGDIQPQPEGEGKRGCASAATHGLRIVLTTLNTNKAPPNAFDVVFRRGRRGPRFSLLRRDLLGKATSSEPNRGIAGRRAYVFLSSSHGPFARMPPTVFALFLILTPAPPPFSAMNSTPAFSRAICNFSPVSGLPPIGPSTDSSRAIVGSEMPEAAAKSP
jgi:hypothetical protein